MFLNRFSFLGLLFISLIPTFGWCVDKIPQTPTSPNMGELLRLYCRYELPLPPKDAPLVSFETGSDSRHLGFLIRPGTEEKGAVIFVGTQLHTMDAAFPLPVKVEPRASSANDVRTEWIFYAKFDFNAGLATALQCQNRGWTELAKALLEVSIKKGAGNPYGIFNQPVNLPPKSAIAHLAWAHWANELAKPGTDRKKIAQRMRALQADEPKLKTEGHDFFLRCLEATLVPSKAKTGSAEALIDDLVDLTTVPYETPEGFTSPSYQKLVEKGFEAVPALIEHLEDLRLSRAVIPGFNNMPARFRSVGETVGMFLKDLADDERFPPAFAFSSVIKKTDAQAWWAKAQKEGEEAYLLQRVLPVNKEEGKWAKRHLLAVLAKKYPQQLAKLYDKILTERSDIVSKPVADAIAACDLPREQKVNLLRKGMKHKSSEIREAAIDSLDRMGALP